VGSSALAKVPSWAQQGLNYVVEFSLCLCGCGQIQYGMLKQFCGRIGRLFFAFLKFVGVERDAVPF
jgi:hypothetical protein